MLLMEEIVFFEYGAEFVVRQGFYAVVLDTRHGFGGYHRIDDRFFDGFDCTFENWVESFVGEHLYGGETFGFGGTRVGRGEGDENIAGTVAGDTAIAAESQRDAARETLELMGNERRVRGDDHDN